MCQDYYNCIYRFPNAMLDNIIVILIEGARGNGASGHHDLIITQYLGGSINRNSDNSELVPHGHSQFRGDSHGHYLLSVG